MSDSPLLIADKFGFVSRGRRTRAIAKRPAYVEPKSHCITVDCRTGERIVTALPSVPQPIAPVRPVITPAMQASIERRAKQLLVEAMVEAEARKLADSAFDAWQEKLPPVAMLLQAASDITGLPVDFMRGASRSRPNVYPRHFAIWLMRSRRPDMSLPRIGKVFRRDHTSIMHALRNVIRFAELEPFKGWLADERTKAILGKTP